MLRVVSSRVVLLGAPFSGCACLRPELWAHSGLELPSREDYNFDPETRRGATGGSPPPLLASFAQLSGYRPLSLTCIYVSVRAARLSCSTPLSRRGRCARATQGSEPLLYAQQARRGFSAVAPTSICAAFSGGAAAPR